jgi:hypothetical protein
MYVRIPLWSARVQFGRLGDAWVRWHCSTWWWLGGWELGEVKRNARREIPFNPLPDNEEETIHYGNEERDTRANLNFG